MVEARLRRWRKERPGREAAGWHRPRRRYCAKELFRNQPDAVKSARVAKILAVIQAGFDLVPEALDFGVLVVHGDIMDGDHPSRPDQRTIVLPLLTHALIGVVAVDEQKIDGPPSQKLPHLLHRRARVRVTTQ